MKRLIAILFTLSVCAQAEATLIRAGEAQAVCNPNSARYSECIGWYSSVFAAHKADPVLHKSCVKGLDSLQRISLQSNIISAFRREVIFLNITGRNRALITPETMMNKWFRAYSPFNRTRCPELCQ